MSEQEPWHNPHITIRRVGRSAWGAPDGRVFCGVMLRPATDACDADQPGACVLLVPDAGLDPDEVVKSWNAHDALLAACEQIKASARRCESCEGTGIRSRSEGACPDCGGTGEWLGGDWTAALTAARAAVRLARGEEVPHE